ncbi:hypothetical protein GGS21DRAFT_535229 [Xylaria nigripes]|nr:hypothetical protein GGS21DRAFT_535229 [Xylaria nigripes]
MFSPSSSRLFAVAFNLSLFLLLYHTLFPFLSSSRSVILNNVATPYYKLCVSSLALRDTLIQTVLYLRQKWSLSGTEGGNRNKNTRRTAE